MDGISAWEETKNIPNVLFHVIVNKNVFLIICHPNNNPIFLYCLQIGHDNECIYVFLAYENNTKALNYVLDI